MTAALFVDPYVGNEERLGFDFGYDADAFATIQEAILRRTTGNNSHTQRDLLKILRNLQQLHIYAMKRDSKRLHFLQCTGTLIPLAFTVQSLLSIGSLNLRLPHFQQQT